LGAFCISYDVHHFCPTFEGDDLEDVHNREQDVVKGVSASNRISEVLACAIDSLWLLVSAVFIHLTYDLFLILTKQMSHLNLFYSVNNTFCFGHAPVLESSSKQLGSNCTKHDHHEQEQHHDIEHDGQRIHDG